MSKIEILEQPPRLQRDERQEILDRLCALEESESGPLHQQWVDEALASGPALSATAEIWQAALQRGLDRPGNRA